MDNYTMSDLIFEAEQGIVKAQAELCYRYYHGRRGAVRDYQEAAKWSQRAAEQGNEIGQYYLGLHFWSNGASGGQEAAQWFKEAVILFEKAIEKEYPYAYYMLGHAYSCGNGITKNQGLSKALYTIAIQHITPLADQGNVDAQYHLGICFYYGRGVIEDHKEALKWFEKAAKQGDITAIKWFDKLMRNPLRKSKSEGDEK